MLEQVHDSPYNIERYLLSQLIYFPELMNQLHQFNISAEYFLDTRNQLLFKGLVVLFQDHRGFDLALITEYLKKHNYYEQIGGENYLSGLLSISSDVNLFEHHLRYLIEKYELNRLRLFGEGLKSLLEKPPTDHELMKANLEKELLEITRNVSKPLFLSAKEVVRQVTDRVAFLNTTNERIVGLHTSFSKLDRMTNGLQKGDLIILAARPSMGKTAFALNIATNVAMKSQNVVAFFSLEMPAASLMTRIIASKSNLEIKKIQTGDLSPEEMNDFTKAGNILNEMNLFIDDSPLVKVTQIHARALALKNKMPNLSLIVVDYLQLIQGNSKGFEGRQQEVSQISRDLKGVARDLGVPVIALSQLSRSPESRNDKRPMLSDLRDSGAIEQDADLVMFLYRDDYYKREDAPNTSVSELIIAKHRNGPTGTIELFFDPNTTSFTNGG